MHESERDLQDYFLSLLENNSFNFIEIDYEDDLKYNFKKQFELFNNTKLSNDEFNDVYDYLIDNPSFDKLKSNFNNFSFIDFDDVESNIFQVCEEITVKRDYTNRYDVTILINGIPIVQIELKKSGVNLKEAFNQIKRYDTHSYSKLFSYIHIFVISNKVHTRFFLNNDDLDYDNSFVWFDNNHLTDFTNSFLNKENLIDFLRDYIFKKDSTDDYIMLRPYQIDAINKVKSSISNNENAYLWMSYASGLTLTSLKLAYLLSKDHKVVYITSNQLSNYPKKYLAKNSKQFLNFFKRKNLVITHIKNVIHSMDEISDERIIFIFNEYEKYYNNYNPLILKNNLKNSLFYLFTHAPIFDDNIVLGKTTKSIFDNHIFTYNLKDYYAGKFSKDVEVEIYSDNYDSDEYDLSSDSRIKAISEFILDKSDSPSIFITSSNDDLINYYYIFNSLNLKIAPIFRFKSNDNILNKPVQDHFEIIVENYNNTFKSEIPFKYKVNNEDIKEKLEADIIKRFNNSEIDLLLIDKSMFNDVFNVNILGNLKSDALNTIFLDCNLKYESLLQVLSMGNIISFRDINDDIIQCIKLYSNDFNNENYELKDYKYYHIEYEHYLSKLKYSKGDFIEDFNKLNNYYLILQTFDEHDFDISQIDEFNKYKDEYEHEMDEIKSSKKEITDYNFNLMYKFTIDKNYILDEETPKKHQNNETKEEVKPNIIREYSSQENKSKEYSWEIIPYEKDFINYVSSKYYESKICPECRKEFESTANFCDSCEELIELINKSDLIKECPCCGVKYPNDYNYCVKCHCPDKLNEIKIQIKDIETFPNENYNIAGHTNKFGSVKDILNENNVDKLEEFNLDYEDYEFILSKITSTYQKVLTDIINEYSININQLSINDKILLLAKSFVIIKYKAGGGNFGEFAFNEINIDDRQNNPLQITSIIHELSHFILAEIFEQSLMILLDTDKTDAVEALVCEILLKDFNYLVDEYCAHTVEGRFAVMGYQDYGSFKSKLNEYPKDAELSVNYACKFGNTFARGIIDILESFINENLREEIKEEFNSINDLPNYSELQFETNECLSKEDITKAMYIIINYGISNCDVNNLERYTIKFKKNNAQG